MTVMEKESHQACDLATKAGLPEPAQEVASAVWDLYSNHHLLSGLAELNPVELNPAEFKRIELSAQMQSAQMQSAQMQSAIGAQIARSELTELTELTELRIQVKEQALEIAALKANQMANSELIESIIEGRETKERLMEGMVQGAEFGKLLGVSRQSINTQRNQGKLVAVGDKNGNYYPPWQIASSNNKIYDVIPSVISEIGYDDDWGHVLFFLTSSELLNDQTPLSWLKGGGDEALILRAAKVYNKHIAL